MQNNIFRNIYHIYSSMLAIMNLVVPDNRAAICPDLDSCQGVTIDVVSFNEASAITKNINSTLVTIKNGIAPVLDRTTNLRTWIIGWIWMLTWFELKTFSSYWPYCGVTVGSDPHACKVIRKDLVFNELAATLFMHVDASCLTMMDLTTNHCRIGVCLHLKASYTVPMDVTALKVTLETENDKPIISPSKWFLAYV